LEEKGTYADIPFLSTMDLLNMRAGTYRPYWYDQAVKAKAVTTAAIVARGGKAEDASAKPTTAQELLLKIKDRQAEKAV